MMVERLPDCNASLTVSTPCMMASWRSSPCGPRPPPGAPSPSVSEQVAEAQRVRHLQERRIVLRVGQHALLPPAPRGLGMDVETAVYLSPRQVGLLLEPHQALREVGWEARASSAVMNALSRHGIAGPPGTQPEPLSNAGASTALPVRLRPWAFRFPVGTLASSVCPYVRAFFVALYWPGPLKVGTNSSDSILPSLVRRAPSASQSSIPATGPPGCGCGTSGNARSRRRAR